ncbi:TPA: hypothetical protein ACLEB8_004885 [Pseudomonas aeruginosa]
MSEKAKKATQITKCKCCGSADLSWQTSNTVRNDIQQGRLNTNDVECVFTLGCNYCSETLAVVSADQVAALMNEQAEAARTAN